MDYGSEGLGTDHDTHPFDSSLVVDCARKLDDKGRIIAEGYREVIARVSQLQVEMHTAWFFLPAGVIDRVEKATELFREDTRFFKTGLIPLEYIVQRVTNFDDFCKSIDQVDSEINILTQDWRQEVASRVKLD